MPIPEKVDDLGWCVHPFEVGVVAEPDVGLSDVVPSLRSHYENRGISVVTLSDTDIPSGTDPDTTRSLVQQKVATAGIVIVQTNTLGPIPSLLFVKEPSNRGSLPESMQDIPVISVGTVEATSILPKDEIVRLTAVLDTHWRKRVTAPNGLVLLGGNSKRMGRDKAALRLPDGRSAARRTADILAPHVNEVFISARPFQKVPYDVQGLQRIDDRYLGVGPSGGLLTALSTIPGSAWLAVACDLPLMTDEDVIYLLSHRDPHRVATCFASPRSSFDDVAEKLCPEPLFAIWEPIARIRFLTFYTLGITAPGRVLRSGGVTMIPSPNPHATFNVNTPDDLEEATRLRNDYP